MEIKRLITHFTYRIEQKPGGGFIAHASDPALPPLEAPTRMELQHKIQDNINAALAKEFPGLKLPENKRISFHLERQADGGFAFHSSDPNAQSASATHEEVENHFAEKMFSLFGKQIISHLPPEFAAQLPPDLAGQIGSGNIKVFVERKVGGQTETSVSASTLPISTQTGTPQSDSPISTNFGVNASDNSPITPGRDNSGAVLRFLIAAVVIIAAMYFYIHLHH
jgi:hypothetical protein